MLMEKLLGQCRKPRGWLGRLVGRSMNSGHTPLRRWGLDHITIEPESIILDIGCGGGRTVKEMAALAPQGKVYGLDLSEDMVAMSRRVNSRLIEADRVEINRGSVSSLPFGDRTFDLATAFETWYFWPEPEEDLKEIRRVLKPKGRLLVANNAYRHEAFLKRNAKLAKWGSMRLQAPDEFRQILERAGFVDIIIDELVEKNRIAVTAVAV